jgi:hypothetical protein
MASIVNATTSSGVVITSDNTGQLQLQSAGTTIATVSSTGLAVTGTIASSTGVTYPIVSGTAQATTSGTSKDFTDIPSWVKRITVMFSGVSTNSTSVKLVQIGTSSGIVSTGYASTGTSAAGTVATSNSTAGFLVFTNNASDIISGQMVLTNITGNTWVQSHTMKVSTAVNCFGGGDITLSGTLDRVRLTTANGTDTFDAGSINILYE